MLLLKEYTEPRSGATSRCTPGASPTLEAITDSTAAAHAGSSVKHLFDEPSGATSTPNSPNAAHLTPPVSCNGLTAEPLGEMGKLQ